MKPRRGVAFSTARYWYFVDGTSILPLTQEDAKYSPGTPAVVQVALYSGQPVGALPQGAFNYFSRAHSIPQATAQTTCVFLVNASLGLYPLRLEQTGIP